MKLFLVMIDAGGAHEPDSVTSIWSNREAAQIIVDQINNKNEKAGYSSRSGIAEIELDKNYDYTHDYE